MAMATSTYEVGGMSCQHCVQSVTGALSELDGVRSVEVDLDAGRVVVDAAEVLDPGTVQRAVESAGYELISSP